MSNKLLSRVEFKRDVPAAALRALLTPNEQTLRAVSAHHLVWTLFADATDRQRDFLWREHAPGDFFLLSDRAPEDRHGLFDIRTPKAFAPEFAEGDELNFELRVNATIARSAGQGQRGKRSDVVMDAIKHASVLAARADLRKEVVDGAARQWMDKQGGKHGFLVEGLSVNGYTIMRIDRGPGKDRASFGVLDLQGRLTISNPDKFVEAVGRGFGQAKAFGCGLMMLRRV